MMCAEARTPAKRKRCAPFWKKGDVMSHCEAEKSS
jgi:hypothetical protein